MPGTPCMSVESDFRKALVEENIKMYDISRNLEYELTRGFEEQLYRDLEQGAETRRVI